MKAAATPHARSRAVSRRRKPADPVDLALQGGGSHGAFTWGVLDALLDDESLEIDGVSGTSAGALNAAVLACGWAEGGRAGAREALAAFWRDIATCGNAFAPFSQASLGSFNLDGNPWFGWLSAWTQQWSPYQFNPGNLNPLRDVLLRHVREPALRASPLRVFVTATSVRTGQPEVFSGDKLGIDALLASACLPQLFQAVQIGGEAYWDGGFVGNPALWPLIYNTSALDIVLVQLDPLVREGTPRTAVEITDRLNEITFNASLVAEMRAIAFVQRLIARNRIDAKHYKALRMHRIADDAALRPLDASSKYNTERALLERLFVLGRQAGQRWLVDHRAAVGVESSFDIESVFLAPRR
jgi:NTE family protein